MNMKNMIEIETMVLSAAERAGDETRLACSDALRIAEKCGVEPRAIGEICDRHGIKIRICQLGCF
jgi:hypothetical protein